MIFSFKVKTIGGLQRHGLFHLRCGDCACRMNYFAGGLAGSQ
ncbi:hypothetical protein [Polaromonas sp.]|nr:hypothetical protein [Polaromonas sp.]